MNKTRLITLLKTFSKQEINRFKDYIISPYFNKNKNVMMLAGAVLEYHPRFDDANFTEESVYKKLFGTEKYDYFKLKNIISDLFACAVSFLKQLHTEKKDAENEITLLNVLHDRKLDNIYSSREKKLKSSLNYSLIKDEDHYLLIYQLERINTAHYKFNRSEYTFNQIQNEFDSFLNYSLTGLLRFYSKMLHNKNHGNINFNMRMFENVWNYTVQNEFTDNPSYSIYKQIISLELSKDENEFRKLLELKEKFSKNIPPEELYYTLLVQNSFAAYMLKLGDESYYKERFAAFREMVEHRFMDPGNVIFPNFISAFTSACMAGEYSWAEEYMKNFQNGVSPAEEKLNTLYYCRAFIAYRRKDFGSALKLFSKTNFKLYLMKVMVRSYTVRIYYEQNMHEQAISAIDAFRHYLKTEKLMAEEQKTVHYEFMKLLNSLIMFKMGGKNKDDDIRLEMLKDHVMNMQGNPLGAKNWLIEKVKELK